MQLWADHKVTLLFSLVWVVPVAQALGPGLEPLAAAQTGMQKVQVTSSDNTIVQNLIHRANTYIFHTVKLQPSMALRKIGIMYKTRKLRI